MAALGAQSIASSYEQLLHVDRDGGGNTTTHVAIKDGDNGTTFGFTIATDALMMSSTNRLEFGDTGTYIHQSADGVLDLVSDTEIEINATTIDINGAVAMDGAMTGGTNITISGELDAATLDISGNADIDGTLEADAYTVDGTALDEFIADTVGAMVGSNTETGVAVTYEDGDNTLDFVLGAAQTTITSLLAADIKIGEDDETKIDFETANEIHFYANNTEQVYVADNIFGPEADSDVDLGATGVRWKDAFVDSITVTGEVDAATLDISGAIDVAGTANLDVVDIDGAVDMASTLTVAGTTSFGDLDIIPTSSNVSKIKHDNASGSFDILGDQVNIQDRDGNNIASFNDGGNTTFIGDITVNGGDATISNSAGHANLNIDAHSNAGSDSAIAFRTGTTERGYIYYDHNTTAASQAMVFTVGDNAVTAAKIMGDGSFLAPKNPAFMATMSGSQDNIAVGSDVTIVFGGTDRFDQGSNFASNTFTAPVTGKYMINYNIVVTTADSASSYYSIKVVTSNITYEYTIVDPDYGQDNDYITLSGSQLVDMDASDTVHLAIRQGSGTQQSDVSAVSRFSGYLAC
jgi:hypothetical protein